MTHTEHLALAADGLRLLAAPGHHPWLKVARTPPKCPCTSTRPYRSTSGGTGSQQRNRWRSPRASSTGT